MQSYFNLVPIYFSEMNLVTYVATYLVFERSVVTRATKISKVYFNRSNIFTDVRR
jgi:hypothetical protein